MLLHIWILEHVLDIFSFFPGQSFLLLAKSNMLMETELFPEM